MKAAYRYRFCPSDKCHDCPPYGEHCDSCGRRVCKLVSVDSDGELICIDCAEQTLMFAIAIGVTVERLESQMDDLAGLVRKGPFVEADV